MNMTIDEIFAYIYSKILAYYDITKGNPSEYTQINMGIEVAKQIIDYVKKTDYIYWFDLTDDFSMVRMYGCRVNVIESQPYMLSVVVGNRIEDIRNA